MTREEQMLLKHFNDLSERAYYQNRPCFTDFLDMNAQSLLLQFFKGPIAPVLYGGYDFAERKIAIFSETPVDSPVCWLEIGPTYPKYAEKLGHRDFLGSILGLGLERVRDFIIQELTQVKHTNVQAKVIEIPERVARPKFETICGTVNSLRLDAVISLAFHLSRSQSCGLIESGQVYINSRLNTSNGATLKDGDMISVRHKGKFIFSDSKNKSKKNKCIVEIHKYV